MQCALLSRRALLAGVSGAWSVASLAQAQTLKVVADSQAPGSFVLAGKPVGLMVDLTHELSRRTGDPVTLEMQPWARALITARREPQVLILSLARNAEREAHFHWVMKVMHKRWCFALNRDAGDSALPNLDAARGLRNVGVVRGDARGPWLREQGFSNLVEVGNAEVLVRMLLLRRLTAAYSSMQDLRAAAKLAGLDDRPIRAALYAHHSQSYIAMSRPGTAPELVARWQASAVALNADGTQERLARRWGAYTEEVLGVSTQVQDGILLL